MGNHTKITATFASAALLLIGLTGCSQPESTTNKDACGAAWPVIERLSNTVISGSIDDGSLAAASSNFKAILDGPNSFELDKDIYVQTKYLVESTSTVLEPDLLPGILVHQMTGLADRCEYLNFDVPSSAIQKLEQAQQITGEE